MSLNFLTDKATGQGRGIGFVRFQSKKQADAAIAAFNGADIPGAERTLQVKYADNQERGGKKAPGPMAANNRQAGQVHSTTMKQPASRCFSFFIGLGCFFPPLLKF